MDSNNKSRYDAVIVGGGMAGLTAAAYLAREKKRVLLLEKNNECGGLVNSFVSNGFLFDTGLRALEDAGIINPMLRDLGIDMDCVRSYVSIGIENEIIHIENKDDLDGYTELLKRFFPENTEDINSIISQVRRVMRDMKVLYGIENPFFKDLKRDYQFIFTELFPWLIKFIITNNRINKMQGPVEEYVDGLTSNRALRDIICQHFFQNTPVFFALSYFSLYLDYHYPLGGTGRLSKVVEEKARSLGSEIKTGVLVTAIDVQARKVMDANGNEYAYEKLLWAADQKYLYNHLELKGCSEAVKEKAADRKKLISGKRGGDSIFAVYLEVNADPSEFRKISHGHFFYSPSAEGVGDLIDVQLKNMLANWSDVSRDRVKQWALDLCRRQTYEISIPVLRDKAAAPPGKTGLIVSLLFDHSLCRRIDRDGWFESFKEIIETEIIDVLSTSVYPMLKENLENVFSITPLSIEKSVASSDGAITGWSFTESVPAVNQVLKGKEAVRTVLPNILQAGQWTYSPAGVPMAILTGKMAADEILKK